MLGEFDFRGLNHNPIEAINMHTSCFQGDLEDVSVVQHVIYTYLKSPNNAQ
jgi:hypothetical protein